VIVGERAADRRLYEIILADRDRLAGGAGVAVVDGVRAGAGRDHHLPVRFGDAVAAGVGGRVGVGGRAGVGGRIEAADVPTLTGVVERELAVHAHRRQQRDRPDDIPGGS